MKNHVLMVLVMMATILTTGSIISPVLAQKKSTALKIGTYDSRVVVLAYSQSDLFKKKMQEMSKESEELLQSKDTVKMKEGALKIISMSLSESTATPQTPTSPLERT